jgi:hypothetical protein
LLHIASNQDGEMENNFITVNGRYFNRHRKWKKSEAFTKIIQGLVSFISFKLAKAKAKSQNIEEMGF